MIPERPLPAASRQSPARAPVARELIVAVMVLGVLALGGQRLRMLLQYDRAALATGEWWRLVTGHLVHLGWDHLALNVAGLIGLWWLYGELCSRREWLVLATVSALLISAALYIASPDVAWYVGLSGVLHGLWAAGACRLYRTSRLESLAALAVLTVKLALEYRYGPLSAGPADGLPVVTVAHRYGALGGLAGTLLLAAAARKRPRRQSL